jgi:hypothetical protein
MIWGAFQVKGMMKRTMITLLSVALLTAGCSDPLPPPAPTPVAPSITETFTGTLFPLGSNFHQFTVNQIGGIKVSLTAIDPGASVGLGVGTPGQGTCIVADHITAVAGASIQMSGTATVRGNFCVSIADVGNLVESVSYTIVVSHS